MEKCIETLVNEFDLFISQKPQNKDEINSVLRELEKKIQDIDEFDQVKYGYLKYDLAQNCLNYLDLSTEQKNKFQSHIVRYEKDYQKYIGDYNQNDQSNYPETKGSSFIECIEDYQIDEDEKFTDGCKEKYFLILGYTGVGKSSLIQKITGDKNVEISGDKESCTQECRLFKWNELKFIDSPGINDTKIDRYQVLLNIMKYLFENDIKLEVIFIINLINDDLNQNKLMEVFSYTYFLYELFGIQINCEDVERLVKEYFSSNSLLNWAECGFHNMNDQYSKKRERIFSERFKASNYFQYIHSYHITVRTYFDLTLVQDLQKIDSHMIDYQKEQIWSNKNQDDIFYGYNDYMKNQQDHLFKKINQIIQFELNNIIFKGKIIYNIVLIGKSKVGKSALIEQITRLKGIRGFGNYSTTQVCQMYSVDFNNITYRFIDTPGFEGTEANQTEFHSLKIIADYLIRNEIKEFKLLYMLNPMKDIRDTLSQPLNKFFFFLTYLFDQDVTFVDTQYLKNLLQLEQNQQKWDVFLQQKILQIYRLQNGSVGKELKIDQKNSGESFPQPIYFKNNCYTNKGEFIMVEENEDKQQKKDLFRAIDRIENFSIEDKILLNLEKILKSTLISHPYFYLESYMLIEKKYQDLYQLSQQINSQNGEANLIELNNQKNKIKNELDSKLFKVVGDVHMDKKNQAYIANSQENNPQIRNKMKNDIQKHFLYIKYDSILYEIDRDAPQNTFLSRKQLHFSSFSHQLKMFIKPNNQNHLEKLEKLAEIKILQEISFQYFQQKKFIEKNYDKDITDNIKAIEVLSQGLNTIFGSGIQIYKYATHFSQMAEETQTLLRDASIMENFVKQILSAISIGIDIYTLKREYTINKKQIVNKMIKTISFLSLSAFYLLPGIGWAVGSFTGCIALIGQGLSSLIYTSNSTFDQAISRFMKSIIDDTLPNQTLFYFQKSEFLKKFFNFSHYSQLTYNQGYEMFEILEVQNFTNKEQKKILLELHGGQQIEKKLLDVISQYIVSNYISKQFKLQFQQLTDEDNLTFLKRITHEIKQNQQLMNIFYNNYDEKVRKAISYTQDQALITIEKQLKSQKQQKLESYQLVLQNQEQVKIDNYIQQMNEFHNSIQNTKTSYQHQVQLGDGYLRKADRFPILFNSYCNLMELKINYQLEQPTISELKKDPLNKKLQVNEERIVRQTFPNNFDKKQLINYLNLLCICDKYITNRYLQKIAGNKPNLTCISQSESLDCILEYSLDLHDLAKKATDYNCFLQSIEQLTKQQFNDNSEMCERFNHFYNSIKQLEEVFK